LATDFQIAIIGSGPAGLSAATHAATKGVPHILLERTSHLNDTIFKYQKRKHVMATPEILPLRSDLDFKEETREEVIDGWTGAFEQAKVNVRFNAEATSVKRGEDGVFAIGLGGGDTLTAQTVILAIGVQGNLNKLRIPGADLPFVGYQLDDPDEFQGEEIVVIGTGDAGLEDALALAVNNSVSIINRVADFPRAKAGNVALIEAAVKRGDVHHFVNSEPKEIQDGCLVVETADGMARVECNRLIARIGAQPPRKFVESCGIEFASADPTSFPVVSETYESQVPGLYIIGALAGYPLIKHCLNQGYEVVEYILGNMIPPADEPLLQGKIDAAGVKMTVTELVNSIRERLPLYAMMTPLQIREFLVHATVHQPKPGDVIFAKNEFANSVYSILDGVVGIQINPADPNELVRLQTGQFFGEMALISGRRRTTSVVATKPSLLLEVDRNTMVKLVRSVPEIKRILDSAAVIRQIKTYLAPHVDEALLKGVVDTAEVVEFKRNDVLIEEGKTDDAVYLIRKGSVTVSVRKGGKEVVLAYLPAGNYVGEMAMITHKPRSATVKAAIATEAIRMDSTHFRSLLDGDPELRKTVARKLEQHIAEQDQLQTNSQSGDKIDFLVRQGLGEATNVLLIDESLCVRCDNCEKACAETHHGISRLNREAGATFNMLHVPTSCRHCEDPHCMSDCPPDAVHRSPNGEVWIDFDQCIGCGNCERNCPYGVIQLAAPPPPKPGLWSWLLFGLGYGPGEDKSPENVASRTGSRHAVKCDMCKGIEGGPACVRACPTGAAIRVDPSQFIEVMRQAQQ